MIVGIDEVGRGPWAGPLAAAAVALDIKFSAAKSWKLTDSKAMSAAERVESARHIRRAALGVGLGWASPDEIDALGLSKAVALAMRRAYVQLALEAEEVIIDGNINYLPDLKSRAVIRADGSIPAVSAASIVAKVARDAFMRLAALRFPGYGFETHYGYGNSLHREAIERLGPSPIHRRSFRPVLQRRLL
jgi:ribonuclease HII